MRGAAEDEKRIARHALSGAAGVLVLLVLTWAAVFHIGFVQHVDASIFAGFGGLANRPHVGRVANLIAGLCDPQPYVVLCAIPVGLAIRRRRPLVALTVLGILAGANLTTELLKPLLAAPRPGGLSPSSIAAGSWPSGHATASMTLALCVVLACPGRWRPYAAAFGAAFAVAVSYSFLTLGWHLPSDAFAGFLVGSVWTLLGIALLARLDSRRGPGRENRAPQLVGAQALTPSAIVLAVVLTVIGLIVVMRPGPVLSYARLHPSFVVGAAGLGALGLVLAAGVLLTLSGSGPDPTGVHHRRWPHG
jgi:membrane-associated phospholipid phosphatase